MKTKKTVTIEYESDDDVVTFDWWKVLRAGDDAEVLNVRGPFEMVELVDPDKLVIGPAYHSVGGVEHRASECPGGDAWPCKK